MYRVTYSQNLKPITGPHSSAIVERGDGWYVVDPMRFERYRAQAEQRQHRRAVVQKKRVEATRSYLFKPATPQVKTRPAQRKSGGNRGKQTMHSRRKFMAANVVADPSDFHPPTTGELIQPLRGREWVSEFAVPLAQASITGFLVAGGTGIILAISHELLETVRAGLVEFGVIGGSVWLYGVIRRARDYDFVDAVTESLPFGALVGIGTAVYYLTVTGSWFTFWWGAALAGVAGFFGLAAQWAGFLGRADDLLYAIERMTAVDLDGDGDIGEPIEPNGVRRIPGNRGGKPHVEELERKLPVSAKAFRSFAIAVLCDKVRISKKEICEHTSKDSYRHGAISQPNYLKIYNYLVKYGFIDTASSTDKNKLTTVGWDELSRWIPESFTPNLPPPSRGG